MESIKELRQRGCGTGEMSVGKGIANKCMPEFVGGARDRPVDESDNNQAT